jgi:helicase MOV-10
VSVAITRAQALLVVVGNPDVLSLDPLWRKFLNYIHKNGGWKGVEITWDPEESVLPGGYDSGVQQRAETEVEAMMARLKSVIVENSENLSMAYLNGNDDGDSYLDGFGRVDE